MSIVHLLNDTVYFVLMVSTFKGNKGVCFKENDNIFKTSGHGHRMID